MAMEEAWSKLGLTVQVAAKLNVHDRTNRRVAHLEIVPFDLPDGCVAGYYPELNPLVPLSHHDQSSKTPAYNPVPVRIERQG